MPKFLYTILFMSALLWGVVFMLVLKLPPISFLNIFIFLTTLFVALSFTLSFCFYIFFAKKLPVQTNPRIIYKKSLKWGLFISFGITGFLMLRAFTLVNIFTGGLFLLLYISMYFQFKAK